ncbi:nicotinamide riboside transporter PnuC [Mucilaginibacter gynuensis]
MNISQELSQWWHQQTAIEMAGFVTGLACVYLAAKNNIWNWPFAIVNVSIYIFIFFKAHLFADMYLQVYFLWMNIYGWYYWSHKPGAALKTPVKLITRQQVLLLSAAVIVFTIILGSVLKYTTASYPYIDSFCAACSMGAQILMARKVLENWLIWIFVNVVYVGVYLFKDLHLTAIMYAVYIGIALLGYIEWRRDWKKQME